MARSKGPNSTRPRANPAYNRLARAQRLRRAKEKEAKLKLCKELQITNERFQDCSQKIPNIDSIPTTSREIPNPHEENKSTSDSSQNVIIIDSFSVIKTEILDPFEKNPGSIFLDNSQYLPNIDSMPAVDSFRINKTMPNIKVEPESEASFPPQPKIEYTSSKNNHTGFDHAIHYNEVMKKNAPTIKSKSACGCLEKIAMVKHLCESYLELVQQDNTYKICLCKADNHTLPENMKPVENLMKELSRLLNPDFGKITC